jgi:molecular chaperone GrpE
MMKKNQNSKDPKLEDNKEQELKNQLARALADYDNLRKRTESEKAVWTKFAKQEVLVKLLPVLDTLEIAQKHLKDAGLELAINEFKKILDEEGVEKIDTEGKFNEQFHEAIDRVEGGEEGKISEVILNGWKFSDGTIIRPARVRVYGGNNS